MPVPISSALALVLAAAFALSLGPSSRAATPSLYANYVPNCTFTFVNDTGAPATTVAPGQYQIVVFTPFAFGAGGASCEFVQFHLTGPGVNLSTDLGGGDVEVEQQAVTLQPGGTYTVQDDGRPGQTRRTFTVATSGSATSTTTTTSSSTSTSTTKGTPSKDIVGSGLLPLRGALAASVGATGALRLLYKGHSVGTLRAGRYTATVTDASKKAGFVLHLLGKSRAVVRSVTVSGGPFVGNRKTTLSLGKGQWLFLPGQGGKGTFFIVTA